ncbi:MAG: septum formation protein Maf [Candidatus Eremiobacter antarcticus]|nr:septum formation protein Maf [Candidatus Eremiobacteraeota bacterium]MBC5808196.1 septum formation protein Maf [Candidatus Eremiobacteraeota bacterium]PZR63588.1 MAG: septum formation protein Maf [Candidatus Eremiobacter sp. RRmetagenome_bin22]
MSETSRSGAGRRLEAVSLASQSPRRKELLRALALRVVVIPSDFDEDRAEAAGEPEQLALTFACAKARMAKATGPAVVIAADTVVALDGQIFGKPKGTADAHAMLRALSGREHTVYTAFVVCDRGTGEERSGVESTRVQFSALSDTAITAYVASGDPLDKAGAYGIQGRGGLLVTSIVGDFYTVMGLPLARVGGALAELGYDLWAS